MTEDDRPTYDEQAIRASERTRCINICNKVQEDGRDLDNVFPPGAIECAARIRDLGPTLSTYDMLMTLAQRVADASYAADKYAASGGTDDDRLLVNLEAHVEEVMDEIFLHETVSREPNRE